MVKGLFTSAEGMIPLMAKQDQIANNLANITTTGYKKSKLVVKTFNEFLTNDLNQPFVNNRIAVDDVVVDYTQGPLKQTDVPLDVAIEGEGFFMVETPQGRRYTRNGNFSIDRNKNLVTSNGYPVVGSIINGKENIIKIDGGNVSVLSDGTVTVDGEKRGKLKIVTFDKPYSLDSEGNSLYKPRTFNMNVYESSEFQLHQGFLETSNADPVQSMVEMISAFRNYEANQRAIWAQNETLGKAVNEVGKI